MKCKGKLKIKKKGRNCINEPKHYCLECNSSFCEDCQVNVHQTLLNCEKENTIAVGEERYLVCQKHLSPYIKFCWNQKVGVCKICLDHLEHKDCTHMEVEELKEKIIKDSNFEKNHKNNNECISETEKQVKELKKFLKEKTTILSKLRKKQIEYETIMKKIKLVKKFDLIKSLEGELYNNNLQMFQFNIENAENNNRILFYYFDGFSRFKSIVMNSRISNEMIKNNEFLLNLKICGTKGIEKFSKNFQNNYSIQHLDISSNF
jgi:hypothetical protein